MYHLSMEMCPIYVAGRTDSAQVQQPANKVQILSSGSGFYYILRREIHSFTPIKNFCNYRYKARSQNCDKRLLASSCPSVRMEQLGSQWKYFREI